MIYDNENQDDVKAGYFDQNQPDNEQVSHHLGNNGKQARPPTLRELLKAKAVDHA